MKELRKSVNIWGSYGQEFGVLFFLRHSVVYYMAVDCNPPNSITSICSGSVVQLLPTVVQQVTRF